MSGVQGSLQSLLHMTTFAAALLCSRFRAFPWLMATSCAAALAGRLSATLSTTTLLACDAVTIAINVVLIIHATSNSGGMTWCDAAAVTVSALQHPPDAAAALQPLRRGLKRAAFMPPIMEEVSDGGSVASPALVL